MKKTLAGLLLVFALTSCTESSPPINTSSFVGTQPVPTETAEAIDPPTQTASAAPPAPASSDPATSSATDPAANTSDVPDSVTPGAEQPGVGGWTPQLVYTTCTEALDDRFDSTSWQSRADLGQSQVDEVTEGVWSVSIFVVRSGGGDGLQGCTVRGTIDSPEIATSDE